MSLPCTCRFDPTLPATMDPSSTAARIKRALRGRTGRSWSVSRGRGTVYGWLYITAPKERLVHGEVSAEDRRLLSEALDESVGHQGVTIPSSTAYYVEYIDRAEGRPPRRKGTPYW